MKRASTLIILHLLFSVLSGCGGDDPQQKKVKQGLGPDADMLGALGVKPEVESEPGLKIEIREPQFDPAKKGPEIVHPERRGRSLDF